MSKKKYYWFYEYDFLQFFRFFKSMDNRPEYGCDGPFESFESAKRYAIERFTCDRDMAEESIRQVRQCRKEEVVIIDNE